MRVRIGGADIVGAIVQALQYIYEMGHDKKGLSRRQANVTDLYYLLAGTIPLLERDDLPAGISGTF